MAHEVIIVVDMLKGFLVAGYPLFCGETARQIIPNVVHLLQQKKEATIIYVCDSHKADDTEFDMFPAHCITGTEETEIIPELLPYKGIVIPKTRYSAFYNTDLEKILRNLSPEKISVVGVCTDICVMYTVADLRNRDYRVEVPATCVASFDPKTHLWALKHMEKILGANVIY